MNRLLLIAPLAALAIYLVTGGIGLQAQEVNFGTPVRSPLYDILPTVAEEKGMWRERGMAARWTGFRTAADLYRAAIAGHVPMALSSATGLLQAEARLPAPVNIMVADTGGRSIYMFWVRTDSPIKDWKDLKGAKIGVAALHTLPHALGLAVVKALGMEKEVKFVGMGGVPQRLAAMRAGVIDVTIGPFDATVDLKSKGLVREILNVTDYQPKEWIERGVFVRRDLASRNPDLVKQGIKVMLAAADYLQQNPGWIAAFLMRAYGYSETAAAQAQKGLVAFPYKENGRVDPKAMKNAANFLAEYGLAEKKKLTQVEQWHTDAFLE